MRKHMQYSTPTTRNEAMRAPATTPISIKISSIPRVAIMCEGEYVAERILERSLGLSEAGVAAAEIIIVATNWHWLWHPAMLLLEMKNDIRSPWSMSTLSGSPVLMVRGGP